MNRLSVAFLGLLLLSLAGVQRSAVAQNTEPLAPVETLEGLEEAAIRAAIDRVAPSVVRIETLGGLEQIKGRLTSTAPTTGLVVTADGYILSSTFNFASKPSSILVTLPGGKRTAAKIVARDASRQIVLLKINPNQALTVPEWIAREQLAVGQWTIAVGRTYPGNYPNVSVGIMSALNRIWGKAVQTDAKISPSNYGGPLIDIYGRVIGVLVPLSPQQTGEFAGSEWYDSGIGFAVPVADLMRRFDTLKAGQDLKPGLLGVSLKGTDIYSQPATIAACPAKSPAREAGLRVGDTIVDIDGRSIATQAQLRHALGPHYAGDSLKVIVERGKDKQRIKAAIELVEKVDPYRQPRLGFLPMRGTGAPSDTVAGVTIRYVFPASPAAKAGLQAGDIVTGAGDQKVSDASQLIEQISGLDPGQTVEVKYQRRGKSAQASLTLGDTFFQATVDLPDARVNEAKNDQPGPPTGVIKVEIPEHTNKCIAYVPPDYSPAAPCGLVVWLHAPGNYDQDELLDRWRPICESESLILVVPQAKDVKRWSATEAEFIRKTVDDVMKDYSIDAFRVVVHGYRTGGSMAYLVALANRDVVRGVAPVSAGLPGRTRAPATDPGEPLAIYSVSSKESRSRPMVESSEKALKTLAFPVISRVLDGTERYLNASELKELVRWIDTLDQI